MRVLSRWVGAPCAFAVLASSAPGAGSRPASSPGAAAKTGRLELVTYNVAGLPEGISRSRPLANLPRIGALLNEFDVALIQEDFAYPHELRRALRHGYVSAPFDRAGRLDFGDGLSHFSRLPVTELRREAWASCHGVIDSFFDCLTPKGFSVARQWLAPDSSVHVYNLHLDAGWSADDRAAREAQVAQLIDEIARSSRGEALLVAGDTNLFGRDRDLLERLLAQTGLRDSCEATRCPDPGRVDRVLFRSSAELSLRPVKWRIAREFVDGAGRPLSDHLAVTVSFVWRRDMNAP